MSETMHVRENRDSERGHRERPPERERERERESQRERERERVLLMHASSGYR